jgi:hypothetical protein
MARADIWMTVPMVREELHFPTDDAARKWIRRRKIARVRRSGEDGRTLLVARRDVEKSFFERRHSAAEVLSNDTRVPARELGEMPSGRSITQ